jgi:diguanylate cyclase (GGDEF)-like protein
MIDVDHFKKINDTYGHQAGDLVLQEYVRCIMSTIREGVDWLARYGGDEFILVLPETDLDKAWKVVERIRCLISEMVIPLEGEEIKITASFGISGFGHGIDGEEVLAKLLIEKADKCLYEAKEAGRNRIVGEGMNETILINNKKTMNVNK